VIISTSSTQDRIPPDRTFWAGPLLATNVPYSHSDCTLTGCLRQVHAAKLITSPASRPAATDCGTGGLASWRLLPSLVMGRGTPAAWAWACPGTPRTRSPAALAGAIDWGAGRPRLSARRDWMCSTKSSTADVVEGDERRCCHQRRLRPPHGAKLLVD
jgi:hypothetical protein